MARSLHTQKGTAARRTKVKTGCTTCRIRKVKCDEGKPSCQRCVGTGRTCDGYESPFRPFNNQAKKGTHTGGIDLGANLRPIGPIPTEIAPGDIELLNRYFSTKTAFDVDLACDEEARQVLQASLTDPTIRDALASLTAFREDFEALRQAPTSSAQQRSSYHHGLQQYCKALGGVASNLSSPSSSGLRSALLCCQIFISIEQAQENTAAMAQHIVQGLRIMHEYRVRPFPLSADGLVERKGDQLPLLDVFVVKLFAAPCKYSDPRAASDTSEMKTTTISASTSSDEQPKESRLLRPIAPDMRAELTRIASSTLEVLDDMSHIRSEEDSLRLLSKRSRLLDALELWLVKIELVHAEPGLQLISVGFMRLFHQVLKVVLLVSLCSSPTPDARTRSENEKLQEVAKNVEEQVKAYRARSHTVKCV